jgi:hypothetical protein
VLAGLRLAVVVVFGVLLCVAAPVAQAAAVQSCGSVSVSVSVMVAGSKAGGPVDSVKAPCTLARTVIVYALTHRAEFGLRAPAGWRCVRGAAPEFSRVAMTCTRAADASRVRLLYR